ncbi:hypothetical protein SDC9_181734 [bioreactor metagenome]|uniref:Uncharacterized protein n=1 Tax=bioreactor metagenome TaxID=1076179 RepID=A0A645H5D3_9ZZZZ
MGIHRLLLPRIIGITPTAAAADVRNIGRILRFPASNPASWALKPCSVRSFSAYSNIMIAFRMIIPIRLTTPSTEVIPKSIPKIATPTTAPGKLNAAAERARTEMLIFLNVYSRKRKMIMNAMISPATISGIRSSFILCSPP